ncbi:MAG: GIY-YIG nuclease family protein [Clostridiales Family XIII bacterium]|nr:GIY-YIG nuclease family protein [Clostridiales Family XIII bacterium]
MEATMEATAQRDEICKVAPAAPGCYLFYDRAGFVVYVGKSKSLRARMGQYFKRRKHEQPKVEEMVGCVARAEFLTTGTELDALLLEHRLIKQHRPRYNAQLKRDRVHPFLRIGLGETRPSLSIVQARKDDGARYFGCFRDHYDAERAIETLNRVWCTPLCGKSPLPVAGTPCLYHHLGRCLAPCAGASASYAALVGEVVRFLDGKSSRALTAMRASMREAANALDFELAEEIRQSFEALEGLRSKVGYQYDLKEAGNLLLLIRPYRAEGFTAFVLRNGTVQGRADFVLRDGAAHGGADFVHGAGTAHGGADFVHGAGIVQRGADCRAAADVSAALLATLRSLCTACAAEGTEAGTPPPQQGGDPLVRALSEIYAEKRFIKLGRRWSARLEREILATCHAMSKQE